MHSLRLYLPICIPIFIVARTCNGACVVHLKRPLQCRMLSCHRKAAGVERFELRGRTRVHLAASQATFRLHGLALCQQDQTIPGPIRLPCESGRCIQPISLW